MALSADQQAMLQLLLERGQSYEDIASVLGVGVDEVRARARAALTELGGADPDAEVGLTDYLLGQADPIGRADAVRHLRTQPDSLQLASELLDRLRELAPAAELPQLPAPRERRGMLGGRRGRTVAGAAQPGEAATSAKPVTARLRHTFSRRQQQAIVALASGAVLVLVAVLAIAGVFGGGGDSEPATEATAAQGDVLETVALEPQGGGDASGEATFGVASGDQPYVEITLNGLSAPGQDRSYVVWLLLSQNQGYPLSPVQVDENDSFSERLPIQQFAIQIAGRARFVDISLSGNRSLLRDLRKAVNEARPILRYEGDSVLRGEIPSSAQPQGQSGGQGGGTR